MEKSGVRLGNSLIITLVAERTRWQLWLPVVLAAGIGAYFALPVEPPRWIGPLAVLCCTMAGIVLRRKTLVAVAAAGLALAATGFTVAAERSASVAAPVLDRPTGPVQLAGRIAEVEPLENGQRLTLDRLQLSWMNGGAPVLRRVRLHLPAEVDARPGQRIALHAVLMPPPPPAAPGAYDFSRQAWFKGLGAVGYAVGPPQIIPAETAETLVETMRLKLANLRHDLTGRIVGAIDGAGVPGGVGAVAAALITAERGPLSPDLLQAYRDAGLAHILVIAGMHMSMVAGLVFVAIRGGLAAIPALALRYPIKKWTAAGALLITFGYLVISGAPVPTQRAFMMNGIILLAVLIDREAISLRSITWAATVILLLQPEALMGASFQLSFAAVYGLISGYEALGPHLARWRSGGDGWWRMPAFYVAGILLTTQIAGSATAFYTIFHFNRYATYSLLGNFLAVPVVGFWVMPAALLAFCLLPFGLDGWGWQLMGWGIVFVNHIALWVSALPGATVNLPSIPALSLVVFTLGGLWLCLWKTRWRLWGLAAMAAALILYAIHQPPDMLVDAGGHLVAVRAADGRLALSQTRAAKSVREAWTKQAGQGTEAPLWREIEGDRLRCDALGCVYRSRGHVVALARHAEAVESDCREADLVVLPIPFGGTCPSARTVIDAARLAHHGTHAIWLREGGGIRIQTVEDWQGDRPWTRHGVIDGEP